MLSSTPPPPLPLPSPTPTYHHRRRSVILEVKPERRGLQLFAYIRYTIRLHFTVPWVTYFATHTLTINVPTRDECNGCTACSVHNSLAVRHACHTLSTFIRTNIILSHSRLLNRAMFGRAKFTNPTLRCFSISRKVRTKCKDPTSCAHL